MTKSDRWFHSYIYNYISAESHAMLSKDASILIVGGGTFGLSTALWLCRNRYRNVTIIDSFDIPSDLSAAFDVNKIIQSSYGPANRFTTMLAIEALELWQNDPVFFPHFHETGIVYATAAGKESQEYEELTLAHEELSKMGREPSVALNCENDFKCVVPQLTGDIHDWNGFYQASDCGWAQSKDSLTSAALEIKRLGGNFVTREVDQLLYDDESPKKVIGVKTLGGSTFFADKVVISAGASSVKLLDFKNQLLAKCWTLGKIKLSEEEAKELKNIPVVTSQEMGFFFEPDYQNELKICNEFPGYTNYVRDRQEPDDSIPVRKNTIPEEAEFGIRRLLRATLSHFADREIAEAKICWCTDTPDRNFLICEHPDYNGSLVLATGDSGHGFKHMPNIGKYIARLICYGPAALGEEKAQKWRWRPETAGDRIQNRFGGSGEVKDLHDIKRWI